MSCAEKQFHLNYCLKLFFIVSLIKPTIVKPPTPAGLLEFRDIIANIVASGGGDCPELALTGMLNALNYFPHPESSMFVFTDASPKDATPANVNQVISFAQSFNIKISFFVSLRPCGGSIPDYSQFNHIAAETNGKIKVYYTQIPYKKTSEIL